MQQVETFFPTFAGTPPGYRRVGLYLPTGVPVAPIVQLGNDWDVSVFVEEETHRTFCIGTSPDKRALAIVRWLDGHGQTRLDCATVAEQQAALGGKDATANTHEELVNEAIAGLTDGDEPKAIVPPTSELSQAFPDEPVADRGDGRPGPPKRRSYRFREGTYNGAAATMIEARAPQVEHLLLTSSEESKLIQAFHHGRSDVLFLFDEGTEYLLEGACLVGYLKKRLQARSPKSSHRGQTPQQVTEALIPNLAPSS